MPIELWKLPAHVLNYGNSGTGKTHLNATAPLPSIVLHFDGIGKAMPYISVPKQFVLRPDTIPYKVSGRDTPVTLYRCYDKRDTDFKTIQRIIYDLSEPDPIGNPRSWIIFFEQIFPIIDSRMSQIGAKTLIIDSMTSLQNIFHAMYDHHIGGKKDDDWWPMRNMLTSKLQWLLMMLAAKPYNTIITCHIETKRHPNADGTQVVVPNLSGRQGDPSAGAVTLCDNVWRCFVKDHKYVMQCTNDNVYIANNNVNAPDECENSWAAAMLNAPTIELSHASSAKGRET